MGRVMVSSLNLVSATVPHLVTGSFLLSQCPLHAMLCMTQRTCQTGVLASALTALQRGCMSALCHGFPAPGLWAWPRDLL